MSLYRVLEIAAGVWLAIMVIWFCDWANNRSKWWRDRRRLAREERARHQRYKRNRS